MSTTSYARSDAAYYTTGGYSPTTTYYPRGSAGLAQQQYSDDLSAMYRDYGSRQQLQMLPQHQVTSQTYIRAAPTAGYASYGSYTSPPRRVPSTMAAATAVPGSAAAPRCRFVELMVAHAHIPNELSAAALEEAPLQLTASTLASLRQFPQSVQESLVAVMAQQNEITLAQLKLQMEATGGTPAVLKSPSSPQQTLSPRNVVSALSTVAPVAPTFSSLDDIQKANQKNLQSLTSNTHIASQMKETVAPKPPSLDFEDEDAVRETLLKLNPAWKDFPEALMAAMKAKLENQTFEFQVDTSSTTATSVPQGKDGLAVHKGWSKVCHELTHQVQLSYGDGDEAPTRLISVVRVYRDPEIVVIPEILLPSECETLISMTKSHWETHQAGMALLPNSPVVEVIRKRLAGVAQCPGLSELHIIKYGSGNEAPAHTDDAAAYASTVLVYLNDLKDCGQTDFINLGFQVQPQAGTAIIWPNGVIDGATGLVIADRRMLHASLPVPAGLEKYVLVAYVPGSGALSAAEATRGGNDTSGGAVDTITVAVDG